MVTLSPRVFATRPRKAGEKWSGCSWEIQMRETPFMISSNSIGVGISRSQPALKAAPSVQGSKRIPSPSASTLQQAWLISVKRIGDPLSLILAQRGAHRSVAFANSWGSGSGLPHSQRGFLAGDLGAG